MKKEWIFTAAIGGCIGALLTMAFGVVVPLGAQNSFKYQNMEFGNITCTRLLVQRSHGLDYRGGRVHVWANDDGAVIHVNGGSGAVGRAFIHADADSATVRLAKGDKIVRLETAAGEHGGRVIVRGGRVTVDGEQVVDTQQTTGAFLGMGEYGGQLEVYGKGTDHRARAAVGVNEYGHGALSTWDKNGYRIRR